MPRFFLHVRDGDRLIEDPDGVDLPTLEAAREEALQAARDLVAARLRAGEVVDGQKFEIADESGAVKATVAFREVIRFE